MFERLKVLLFQKKIQTEAKDIPFFGKNSVVSRFVTLSLEIPEKSKLHPWTFHKIVSHHLEILKPETKIPGSSTIMSWSPKYFNFL